MRRKASESPFGVEVTQIFPSEAHARLSLVPGYMQRLWAGGEHLHKRDVKVLQSVTVQISDKDANVEQSDVSAIITERPRLHDFRAALAALGPRGGQFLAHSASARASVVMGSPARATSAESTTRSWGISPLV